MNEIITIDGVKYKRIEEEEVKPKYKVGDWVKVIANCTLIAEKNDYVGQTYQITNVYNIKAYPRGVMPYGIGKDFAVYEDEIEPAEEPKKSIFDCNVGDKYYIASSSGGIFEYHWDDDTTDNAFVKVANCCKDKKLMEQRALHEELDRLLWQASVEVGELDNPWDGNNKHWAIYRYSNGDFMTYYDFLSKNNTIYFPTKESAHSAIDNIVKPFMKEHPDFEW